MAKAALKLTLPKGVLVYPALQRPDTKYNKLGDYKADVKLPEDVAKPIIEKVQAVCKAHMGKPVKPGTKNAFYSYEKDENEEKTGYVIFSIRSKNRTGKDGKVWDRRPMLIDAKKNPIDVNPWGGSTARVQFETYEWIYQGEKGVSLQPLVVQIIDLVTGQGAEPQLDDFDEEDGFTSDDTDTSDFEDESGDAADTSSDDDEDADY